MAIEFVCKIKFAEGDEKQKEKEEGDKESLIEEPARPRSRDLAAFASASTLHGLGHICRSGRLGVRQTLWAFAFLASLAFFLYQAAKSALLYLEHPHVMALDEEAIREMVFPAITICNINRYRHSALTDADIFHLANMTGLPPKDRDGHKATDLLYPDPDMADIVNRTGHQLDDMLKSCNFSGENCSSRDFAVSDVDPLPWSLRSGTVTASCGQQGSLSSPARVPRIWTPLRAPAELCPGLSSPRNESICSPNVYIECADHTLDAAVEDSQERCSCPTPCNLTRYGKEISMVRIPNKGSARYLARKYNKNETYIRENFLVLDIFFEALNYEAIEQKKAYDLAGLLGDIGGQMGLFIGASILTILEILDYVYEVIRDRVTRLLRRSKPPLKKPSGSIATLGLEELKDQHAGSALSQSTRSGGEMPHDRDREQHRAADWSAELDQQGDRDGDARVGFGGGDIASPRPPL
nr:PREDICTED: acid-sensing ion channel 4 [Struthio camelus australis]